MYHITVSPDTYEVRPEQEGENPFLNVKEKPILPLAKHQHAAFRKHLQNEIYFEVTTNEHIPDFVFFASGGLSLPRLPEPVVILPSMKYKLRQQELPYDKAIFDRLKIKTYELPKGVVFEGKAEVAWFRGGTVLLHGYGYRSTRESVFALQRLLAKIYKSYGVTPPRCISLREKSPRAYHLDMALLAYSDTECCIKAGIFDSHQVNLLRTVLDKVTVLQSSDPFVMNGIVFDTKILVSKLQDPGLKRTLESITGKKVVEVDVSEFQKSGGSVACLVLPIYDPRFTRNSSPS
jgi:N-dimethylarginine dimethylaminohydrolase